MTYLIDISVSALHFQIVQRCNEDKEHLLVYLNNVVPNEEDDSSEFTSNRNGVLRIK